MKRHAYIQLLLLAIFLAVVMVFHLHVIAMFGVSTFASCMSSSPSSAWPLPPSCMYMLERDQNKTIKNETDMNTKSIKYWVMFNGQRGILDETLGKQMFIAEQDFDKHFTEGAVRTGEFAYDEGADMADLYSYDNPREVVYEDCGIEREGGFWMIEKRYQTAVGAKIDEAHRQLMVDTGWKADWMSERTKMMKRIDECRKADVPCGHLRVEWEKIIESYLNAYDDEPYQDVLNDWCVDTDFFTLVAEVESMYSKDDDEEEDEDD